MENNIGEKNTKLSKELTNPDELSIKMKIFNFYFYVLRKKDINMFLCGFLLILETFQLVSYALTTPHMNNWGVKTNTMDYIQLIVGAPRITPLMKYLKFDYFIIIYGILLGYIFLHCLLLAMIIKFSKTQSKFYQLGVAFTRYFTTPLTTAQSQFITVVKVQWRQRKYLKTPSFKYQTHLKLCLLSPITHPVS